MYRYSRWSLAMALVCALIVMSVLPAEAQKKKKAQPPSQQQVQPQQPVVTPSPRPSGGFRDMLAQYQGSQTNLGIMTKVGPDFIVLDDEGVISYHPIHVIQTIRVTKLEEGGEKIELKLLSKD